MSYIFNYFIAPLLGEYLENFEKNSSLSLTHASLTDLKIKRTVFERFSLPFEVKLATIKRIDLDWTLWGLRSSPVVAKADKIFLVI